MPHRYKGLNTFSTDPMFIKCPCGQSLSYQSERDMRMKIKMHHKFCPNPINEVEKKRNNQESIKYQKFIKCYVERNRKVHS